VEWNIQGLAVAFLFRWRIFPASLRMPTKSFASAVTENSSFVGLENLWEFLTSGHMDEKVFVETAFALELSICF
jgi:hypothetical protein